MFPREEAARSPCSSACLLSDETSTGDVSIEVVCVGDVLVVGGSGDEDPVIN